MQRRAVVSARHLNALTCLAAQPLERPYPVTVTRARQAFAIAGAQRRGVARRKRLLVRVKAAGRIAGPSLIAGDAEP